MLSTNERRARQSAQAAVGVALRKGVLTREPCEVCGALESEAHHDDHAKPLDVRWLCRAHHRAVHRRPDDGRKPTLLRAALTSDEWTRLRKLALDQGLPSSHMIGKVLRDFLQLHDPQPERKRRA